MDFGSDEPRMLLDAAFREETPSRQLLIARWLIEDLYLAAEETDNRELKVRLWGALQMFQAPKGTVP